VEAEVVQRLHSRYWKPGDFLPNEAELAIELGCARSTVNRALQSIADDGLIERRRKGGTRVVVHPARKATFSVPVIRQEIEARGHAYGYRLISRKRERPPKAIRTRMNTTPGVRLLHLIALHLADERAYVLEDRWIDVSIVPEVADADFQQCSPNQWLVENVPFSGGDLALSASIATDEEAVLFEVDRHVALFTAERRTRNSDQATITSVRLVYSPGYRMEVEL
jgi:GntR family histidine utilization transcriptional repressor